MSKRHGDIRALPTRDLAHVCIVSEIGHTIGRRELLHAEQNGHLITETWALWSLNHDHFRYQVDVVVDEWEWEYRVVGLYVQEMKPISGPDGELRWGWEEDCRVKLRVDLKPYRMLMK